MPEYTVIDAKKKKDVPDAKFGAAVVYELTLDAGNGSGNIEAEWFTKAATPLPQAGERLEGELSEGKYGKDFKRSQNGSGGFGRSPRDSRRIERQHSQEMAVRAISVGTGGKVPENIDLRSTIRDWTDWFQADLDVGSGSGDVLGRSTQSPDSPAAASSAERIAISDKQKGFLERLLKEKGADSDQVNLITFWASENLTGGREGSASKAIDGLQKDSDATLERLLLAAKKWQRTQTDIPADTAGLDEGTKDVDDIPW